MSYDFDRYIERYGTNCKKWDDCIRMFGSDEVLPMWLADMDFAAPPEVVAALKQRADHEVFGYVAGADTALDALIRWMDDHYGWTISKEWVVLTPGVVTALSLVVLAYSAPGDKIIVQPPVYPPFFSVVRDNDRVVIENPLLLTNGYYTMNLDQLEEIIDERVKMIVLCSPHNPVGRVWKRVELERLGQICLERGLLLVSDEIHSDIVFHGHQHICTASISEELQKRTITLTAPSKTFNLAGLTTSFAIISDPELRRKFKTHIDRLHIGAKNIFGLVAMEASYRYGQAWLNDLLLYLEENRDFLVKYVKDRINGITVYPPEGTFLAWLDCRGLGMDPERLKKFFNDEARIGINYGSNFGSQGEGFVRLNFGCPRLLLREGLRRLEEAVGKLAKPTSA